MKTVAKIVYFSFTLVLLAGCGDNAEHEDATHSTDNPVTETTPDETDETEVEETTAEEPDTAESEADQSESNDAGSEADQSESTDTSPLAAYSNKLIEYARVWLQLGPNQELDGLYVNHIPAGTPLNPDDETSAAYPEDVIQLAGSRLVDGSITYSGNGNGTINVYNVPLRWDGQYPAGEEFYQEIIEGTEMVAIDVGDKEEVISLIGLLEVQ